uniref:Maturase K n=1 Tax=Tristicha trifaria TaxID=51607 RepID=I7GZV5_9ROSI|nr:maturase K [Tristicha trifaria]BAM33708.1 maturase K [Tristicha trifaria]
MRKESDRRYLALAKSTKNAFLYPLIFQEYIYILAHDHNLNRYTFVENFGYTTNFRFLIVKRLIARMYHQNYLHFFSVDFKQNSLFRFNKLLYSQIISEVFAIIVEIPFSLQFGTSFKKVELVTIQNLQSIHSIFPFLEDKFNHFNFVVNGLLPYPIHLEKLVQILRYWLKDPSSLHFLRFFLHEYWNGNNSFLQKKNTSFFDFEKKNLRFFVFLYNSYIYEYESIFFFIRRQFFHLPVKFFHFFGERIYFYVKIKKFQFRKVIANSFPIKLEVFKDLNLHYIRYQGKFLFGIRGMPLIMDKWKHYFVTLFECYFDVWFQPDKIQINLVSKHSLIFVGYLLSVKFMPSVIRSHMLQNAFSIDNTLTKMDTIIPINPMIESLSQIQFCNKLGHPVSKPTWTDLLDSDIIDRFVRLCKNIAHFYSGSSQKKVLYQIHYILRFSCLKTLARKHKISVRAFLKKQGCSFLEDFFTEEQIAYVIFPRESAKSPYQSNQYQKRLWYLDILSINDLVNHT